MRYGEFGYGLGELAQLREVPGYCLIRWRGWMLLGPTGQRYWQAVYWLGPMFWDCHYEDELVMLGRRG